MLDWTFLGLVRVRIYVASTLAVWRVDTLGGYGGAGGGRSRLRGTLDRTVPRGDLHVAS